MAWERLWMFVATVVLIAVVSGSLYIVLSLETAPEPPLIVELNGYTFKIQKITKYVATVRAVGGKQYESTDHYSITPYDICTVEGKLMLPEFKDLFSVTMRRVKDSGSTCNVQYVQEFRKAGISYTTFVMLQRNNHIMPANETVREKLSLLKDGDIVSIRGHLADAIVTTPDGKTFSLLEDFLKHEKRAEIILIEDIIIHSESEFYG